MFLAELTFATNTLGNTTTLGYASGPQFMTAPTENPSNTPYEPRILKPGNYERHCWQKGTTRGRSTRAYGGVTLANNDGALDILMTYGADGQSAVLRQGPDIQGAYPSAYPAFFTGIMRRVDTSWTEVDVILTDRQGDMCDKPYQTTKYAGTNSGSSGLEGLTNDLEGKPKPKLRGTSFNFAVPCVNTSSLIYQIDDGTALTPLTLSYVYDKGSALTIDSAQVSLAALIAASPSGGHCTAYAGPEGWYVKVGTQPSGTLTVTASEGALANRTVAQIASRIASNEGGLPLAQIVGIAALDAAKPYEIGFWSGVNEYTCGSVLDQVLDSANAFFSDSRAQTFNLGWLQDPTVMASVLTINQWQIKAHEGITVSGVNDPGTGFLIEDQVNIDPPVYSPNQDTTTGLPCWRVRLYYNYNNTVQTETDLAGSALAEIAYTTLQYRTILAANPLIRVEHIKAPEFTATTMITNAADATTEANSQLALRSVMRYIYEIPVDPAIAVGVDLGQAFTLVLNRFGCNTGKQLLCIGLIEDFGDATTAAISTIVAWG